MRPCRATGIVLSAICFTAMVGCGVAEKFRGKGSNNKKANGTEQSAQQAGELQPDPNAGSVPGEPTPTTGDTSAKNPLPTNDTKNGSDAGKVDPSPSPSPEPKKKPSPAEFVFMIDSSLSMSGSRLDTAIDAVQKQVKEILKVSADLVPHIYVITSADIVLPEDKRVVHIDKWVTGNNPLTLLSALAFGALKAVDNSKAKLNPDIKKDVLLISDGNAGDELFEDLFDAEEFSAYWQYKKFGAMSFNSIIGLKKRSGECEVDEIGSQYSAVSKGDDFKGEVYDICKPIGESTAAIVGPILKTFAP